jgi:PAS domain S-box-containing protein
LTETGEAIGKSVLDYAAPESRDSIKKKMLSGHDQPYEATGLRKDGTRMYGELMGRNIIYKGRQARVVAVRDLSDRKKAEDALRESEERYRSVIETCPDAITLSSLDGSLITANLQSARLYGCDSVEELLSSVHSAFDIISSEDQHRAAENAKKTLKEGTVRNVEYRMVRKDGSTHPAELSASTILDAEGKPKAFVGVVRDISERKQVEQALRESEERYRTLVETSPDAIVMTDTTNKLVMVNQGTAQLLGYDSAEEVMEKVDNVFAHIDQEFHETAQRKFENYGETRGTRASVYRLVRRDKSKVYVEVNSSVIPDADGNMAWVISVIRDITDRIEAEEERRKLEEQIQHAQKLESLGILAGGIAHDFNNLLMGVLGNASLALLDLPEGLPVRHCVEQIEKTARAAADLTNQMLAYSGKGRFVVEPLDLSKLVKDMAGLLKVSISKKVDLKFDFDRDLPPVEADAAQFRQVIMNLIINASEAIGDEPGVVSVRTGTVEADSSFFAETYTHDNLPEGTYVYLEVADSGCGMDPGTISRIFDPFFTSKFTGRGLGLAAVLGIVRGHQGAVRVQSEPGQGSTIRVVFPPAKAGKHPPAPEPQRKKPGKVGGKILVVDDEATIRDVARRMLESSGFEVITAADGRDAVEIFKDQGDAIAGVLLDATMPQMDGLETFEELRRVRKDVRVVLSSGYSEQEATQRFTGKGLTGFIQKPYRFDELIDKMNEVLGE